MNFTGFCLLIPFKRHNLPIMLWRTQALVILPTCPFVVQPQNTQLTCSSTPEMQSSNVKSNAMPESSVSVMMLVHLIQTGGKKSCFDEIFTLRNTFSVILVIIY